MTACLLATILVEAAETPLFWWVVGALGTACWGSRFVIQWIASERAKKSIVPTAFWYLSIGGALLMLSYAIFRRDPIFVLQYSGGCFIYFRNLHLVRRERARAS